MCCRNTPTARAVFHQTSLDSPNAMTWNQRKLNHIYTNLHLYTTENTGKYKNSFQGQRSQSNVPALIWFIQSSKLHYQMKCIKMQPVATYHLSGSRSSHWNPLLLWFTRTQAYQVPSYVSFSSDVIVWLEYKHFTSTPVSRAKAEYAKVKFSSKCQS